MLRWTRSMSMTATGVRYSGAIFAASGVVIISDSSPLCRHCEEQSDEVIRLTVRPESGCVACPRDDGRKYLSLGLLDLFTQQFKFQPRVFWLVKFLLCFCESFGGLVEFSAILVIEIGVIENFLLPGNFVLEAGNCARQGFPPGVFP